MALLEENIHCSITCNSLKLETTQMFTKEKEMNKRITFILATIWMNVTDILLSGKKIPLPKEHILTR